MFPILKTYHNLLKVTCSRSNTYKIGSLKNKKEKKVDLLRLFTRHTNNFILGSTPLVLELLG